MPQRNNLVGVRKRFKRDTINFSKVAGFVNNQIRKWLPKASMFGYTYEDLYNEAYLAFYKALQKYKGESTYGSHFFYIFKKVLYQEFHGKFVRWYDLDRKDVIGASVCIDETSDSDESENIFILPGVPVVETSTFLYRLNQEAPEVVVEALNFMMSASPDELVDFGFAKKGSHGYNSNRRFCEVLGYDPSTVNIMDEVKKFIINAD